MPAGAEAAQAASETVLGAVRAGPRDVQPDLAAVVRLAGDVVSRLGRGLSPVFGMATTLTLGCVRGGILQLAHVGDSRCYAWRDGALSLLTEDHTVANEAKRDPRRSYSALANPGALTRCVGQPDRIEVDITERQLRPEDRLLFCTDGLYRPVADREIAAILSRETSPVAAMRRLVALALKRGGPDNTSGVAVYVK